MKHEYALLRYDPHKIKMKMYRLTDKILPKTVRRFYPISYAYDLNRNEYYLNLNHKKWCHPRVKEEIYTYSFLDLYENALNKAINIINNVNEVLYDNKPIKELDKAVEDQCFDKYPKETIETKYAELQSQLTKRNWLFAGLIIFLYIPIVIPTLLFIVSNVLTWF